MTAAIGARNSYTLLGRRNLHYMILSQMLRSDLTGTNTN